MCAIEKIKRTFIPWESSRHSFAAFALDRLATHMESVEPDKFCKAYVVAFLRETSRLFAEDSHNPDGEESYRQQLRFCREHNTICLESYRRHGAGKHITADRRCLGVKNCNKNLKPRRESRANFCPYCGAILEPGKERKCLYELPTENHRKPQTKRGDRHEQR